MDGAGAWVVLDDVFGFYAAVSGDAEPERAARIFETVGEKDGAVCLGDGAGEVAAGVDADAFFSE